MTGIHSFRRIHPVRNVDAGALLELFLVCAVVAFLGIRIFLGLTGYPQVGGRGLHIAHMLWGGALMLIAIVMLVAFLGKSVVRLAAALGGLGFGTFIDELGKFITADNDYFFQPTFALIYVIFIALFLTFRAIARPQRLTEQEALVNVFDLLKEAARRELDVQQKRRARDLLDRCNPNDPMVPALTAVLQSAAAEPRHAPGRFVRLARWGRRAYMRIVEHAWFASALVILFAILAVVDLATAAYVIVSDPGFTGRDLSMSFVDWADLISGVVFGALVVIGITRLRTSRAEAYRWFRRSILISIFFGQVFYFYSEQLFAAIGLAISLLLLAALNYMMRAEEEEREMAPA